MRFISWNVNGLRAVLGKNFREAFEALDADFFCAEFQRLLERNGIFVRRLVAVGLHAGDADNLAVLQTAEDDICISNVDCKQHVSLRFLSCQWK